MGDMEAAGRAGADDMEAAGGAGTDSTAGTADAIDTENMADTETATSLERGSDMPAEREPADEARVRNLEALRNAEAPWKDEADAWEMAGGAATAETSDERAASEPEHMGETEQDSAGEANAAADKAEEEKSKMKAAVEEELLEADAGELVADVSAEAEKEQAGETEVPGEDASDAKATAFDGNASGQPKKISDELAVFVNDETVVMHGKPEYVFIDVFDYIDFDLSDSRGRGIITQVNDKNAYYTQTLKEGDRIVIRWEEKE